MDLYVGTSGYSYKEWKGNFYPEKIAAQEMLAFYGTRLPAVEINATFYRLPRSEMLENWASQVPDDFRFALKASRRITHIKRLKYAEDETSYLLETASVMKDKLGVILFQLAPSFKKDLQTFDAFLKTLPDGAPAAFEFRHETWFDEEVYERLRARDFALCVADTEDKEARVVSTASWGYLRLRRPDYGRKELAAWADQVLSQEWRSAYVFFKHEDEGIGPALATRFLELAAPRK